MNGSTATSLRLPPLAVACVTGGAGFIGSHLVDRLVAGGVAVRVIDDFSTGREDNLVHHAGRVEVVRGSINDESVLERGLGGVHTVFHLAAYVSAPGSVREPFACHEINTTGTLRLLEVARRAGVKRVVFASSAAVYGNSDTVPKREDQPIVPCTVYAQSKAAGEHLLQVWTHCHGLEAVSLRFFNVFGPRQRADSAYAAVIAAFADGLITGRGITIFGDGRQTRDFVPVANIVQGLVNAAEWEGPAQGQAFNLGLGTAISIRELAGVLATIAGSPDEPRFLPARAGDVTHSLADITRARQVLGFSPCMSVEQGLRETFEWYRGLSSPTRPSRT